MYVLEAEKKARFGLVKNVDWGVDSVHPKTGQETSDQSFGIQCSVPLVWGVSTVPWVLCSPEDTDYLVTELV